MFWTTLHRLRPQGQRSEKVKNRRSTCTLTFLLVSDWVAGQSHKIRRKFPIVKNRGVPPARPSLKETGPGPFAGGGGYNLVLAGEGGEIHIDLCDIVVITKHLH